ncbi:unnamed protein product [Adineta ricciae]|uniref:inositol-phosphate phosphatase n=1 Tax=Adineta ricciae TaxID=249248 RepID=A0A813NAS5_ADIRI|nr:unnamed protein product [Adineta ricciae]CAF1135264.1 unnamed protein product [Adineta ricciae]
MLEHDIDVYYKTVLDLVSLAGKVVSQGFSVAKRIETKSNTVDLVTEYDQRIEEILIKQLREKFPTHKFIGEESSAAGHEATLTDDPTWIIDPIDGTTNFVHGFPMVAICVALAINKDVIIAVVFNPILDHLYSAVRGKGAFKNGRPIQCSKQTELGLSQVIGAYGYSRDPAVLDAKSKNQRMIIEKAHSIRMMGSAALSLCLIAEGSCDAYVEYGAYIWDYAASDLIAREAGAYTCDPTGAPLNLSHRRMLCAATKELAEQISPLLTHIDYVSDSKKPTIMKRFLFLTLISIFVGLASSVPDATCRRLSNSDCEQCLKESGCAFCQNNKQCFAYDLYPTHPPCSTSDLKFKTCFANLQTWLIILGSVGGVILIAIIVIIICCRKKCIQRTRRRDQAKEDAYSRKVEERRVEAGVRSEERKQAADNLQMILPSICFVAKQCQHQWRSPLFRSVLVINQRRLATSTKQKKDSKKHDNNVVVQSTTENQIEVATFKEKAQQAAKDTGYSIIVIAGVAALGGLCYLMLRELYSRETPNGIYKEASKMCLANTEVQDALGTPIMVHTTPQVGSMRINNVRAKVFDEKGHRSMTLAFYLTGKERSGVVGVKVQKNISNKFVYDYILVQLDRPWRGRNIIQVHQNLDASKPAPQALDL